MERLKLPDTDHAPSLLLHLLLHRPLWEGKGSMYLVHLCALGTWYIMSCHQTRAERVRRMKAGCSRPQAPVCATVCAVPNSGPFHLYPSPGVGVGRAISRVLLLPAPESGKPAPGHLGRALRTQRENSGRCCFLLLPPPNLRPGIHQAGPGRPR